MGTEPTPAVQSPILYRPVWADPGFILSTNDSRTSDVAGGNGATVKLANNNPKRWAIGFVVGTSLLSPWTVAPWIDPQSFGWPITGTTAVRWFDLFTYGPIICHEWYGLQNGFDAVRVVEIEIG